MDVSDVVFREDLYPRFEPDQSQIQRYSESIEYLPPITVNQNNILIDGFHRLKAHQLAEESDINVDVVETNSEKELKKLAYQMNSNHGLQLNNAEKRKYAQEMYGELSEKELSIILSVSKRTVRSWTTTQRKALKEERDRKIVELYLRAWNSYRSIADVLGVDHTTVIDVVEKGKDAKIHQNFKPFLYNIWNTAKQDNNRKHFGAFPEIFLKNLLYYHTKPLDIIYDPFGGGGTTVDVCKQMFRRYYVSDRKVIPGREKEIRQHDIKNGLPEDLRKPNLVFLDPPYWKQAENQYSEDADDLGNMSLDEFNKHMNILLSELSEKKVERIAIVIQPTQYKNNWKWTDHIFDFADMLPEYEVEMRYILPYSTQQYNAQMVEKTKDSGNCLCIHRDLVVFKHK